MFHCARYKYLKTLESSAIIKLEKRFFLMKEGRICFKLAIIIRLLALRYSLPVFTEEMFLVYLARVSESQTHLEDWFATLIRFSFFVTYVVWFVFYFGLNS